MKKPAGRIVRAAVALVVALAALTLASAHRPADAQSAPSGADAFARALLERTNVERVAAGLLPLMNDDVAYAIAQNRAREMAETRLFAHERADGTTAEDDLRTLGVPYQAFGENLGVFELVGGYAFNADLAPLIADAWLASESHRANLLSPLFGRAAIGVAANGDTIYITMIFLG